MFAPDVVLDMSARVFNPQVYEGYDGLREYRRRELARCGTSDAQSRDECRGGRPILSWRVRGAAAAEAASRSTSSGARDLDGRGGPSHALRPRSDDQMPTATLALAALRAD